MIDRGDSLELDGGTRALVETRTEGSMNGKSIMTHDRSRQKFNDMGKKGN